MGPTRPVCMCNLYLRRWPHKIPVRAIEFKGFLVDTKVKRAVCPPESTTAFTYIYKWARQVTRSAHIQVESRISPRHRNDIYVTFGAPTKRKQRESLRKSSIKWTREHEQLKPLFIHILIGGFSVELKRLFHFIAAADHTSYLCGGKFLSHATNATRSLSNPQVVCVWPTKYHYILPRFMCLWLARELPFLTHNQ